MIGDVAPEVIDGIGEFVLPLGFEYQAAASVHCNAGDKIENRESNTIKVNTKSGSFPREITFTLPGPTCHLWAQE